MTKLLTEEQLRAACAKTLTGPGHRLIEEIRQDSAALHPDSLIRIKASSATQLVAEVDLLREAAARLGGEVRASRSNLQLQRDAAPPRHQSCFNCRYFDPVISNEAHVEVPAQAIVKDAGVCCRNPPVEGTRTTAGVVTSSNFPRVHPSRWCGHWQHLDNRMVPSE